MSDFTADVEKIAAIEAVPTILEVACRATGLRFAAVARVTEEHWIACAVRDDLGFGLARGGELRIETTICNEVRQSGKLVVIDHVAENDQFRQHPTPAMYGFQSYISVPIYLPDGAFFGTLCALDPEAASVDRPEIIDMFKLFAQLIAFQFDASTKLAASEATLSSERETSELREQFIAVLGHDLRNPLASIDAGTRLLQKLSLDERAGSIVGMMRSSVARMADLIENVLDFARGRLGGGIHVTLKSVDLAAPLLQVIAELRSAWPQRHIEAVIDLTQPVWCDSARIAQLISNLLANALVHGDAQGIVKVDARVRGDMLVISVANRGAPIPADILPHLFQPFKRAAASTGQQGLGLGLFIAAEIARAHHGTLDVHSNETETRFDFTMPSTGLDRNNTG